MKPQKESLSPVLIGNLACLAAYLIFGFNIVFCKNIANSNTISPIALFCMRAIGSLILFWAASFIDPQSRAEKMQVSDLWKVAIAAFLGLFVTQLAFLKAITMTTAIDASILSLLSPIMAMIVAAIVIKDKITINGVTGLTLSLCGVLFLVLNTVSVSSGADQTTMGGILYMIANTLAFALYTGIFKPLIQKYSVITFMKWMFLFSTMYSLPFGFRDLLAVDYHTLPVSIIAQVLYVVVFATFVAYFLIPVGQKRIKPMIVCMYSYVQPVIAMLISLAMGLDTMTLSKGLATILVFVGVGIVNFGGKIKKTQ